MNTTYPKKPTLSRIRRILVVEDNLDLSEAITDHLTDHGFDVHVNHGFRIGIGDILSFKPDLLIADWMLPSIEGIQLIRLVKSMHMARHIPCILMTGRRSESDAIIVYDSGADAYLAKPFSMNMLMAVIMNLEKRNGSPDPAQTALSVQSEPDRRSIVRLFIELVEKRYTEPDLHLDALCADLHCTRQTLIQRTKRATGLTPYAYLKRYRLERAREALLAGDMSVTDTAYSVGYQDLAVFSKMFKSEFGISPKQYVQSMRLDAKPDGDGE